MKASKMLWFKRIVIGAAVAALPQVLLARAPDAAPPPPGMLHGLPLLQGVDLSETQQDTLFELVHAQIPVQRALEKKAVKALDELHRLSASEQFNAKQARALAEAYAQAQAQLTFNQAELESKLRALLTAEQRQQLDAPIGPRPAKP